MIHSLARTSIALCFSGLMAACGQRDVPPVPEMSVPAADQQQVLLVSVSGHDAQIINLDIDRSKDVPRAVVTEDIVDGLIAMGDDFNDLAVQLLLRLYSLAESSPEGIQSKVLASAERWAAADRAVAHRWLATYRASGDEADDPQRAIFHAREAFRLDLGAAKLLPTRAQCLESAWVNKPYCSRLEQSMVTVNEGNAIRDGESTSADWTNGIVSILAEDRNACWIVSRVPNDIRIDECLAELNALASAERIGLFGAGVRAVLRARSIVATGETPRDVKRRFAEWLKEYASTGGQSSTEVVEGLLAGLSNMGMSASDVPVAGELRQYFEKNPRAEIDLLHPVLRHTRSTSLAVSPTEYCHIFANHVQQVPRLAILSPKIDAEEVLECVLEGAGPFVPNAADAIALYRFGILGGGALTRILLKYHTNMNFPLELASGRGGNVDLDRAVFWATVLENLDELPELSTKAIEVLGPAKFARLQRAASAYGKLEQTWAGLEHLGLITIDETRLGSLPESRGSVQQVASSGSAFYITDDGYLVSNAHVVDGCDSVAIANGGPKLTLVAADIANDLALLKNLTTPFSSFAVPVRRAGAVLGETVVTLGFPMSSMGSGTLTVTSGEVSALGGPEGDSRLIQISAPIQPGSSGGPIMDATGQSIGMASLSLSTPAATRLLGAIPQNVNYGLRASTILGFLESQDVDLVLARGSADVMTPAEIARRYSTSVVRVVCEK